MKKIISVLGALVWSICLLGIIKIQVYAAENNHVIQNVEEKTSDNPRSAFYEEINPQQKTRTLATKASLPVINAADKNVPTKDFIDVSSHNGTISVNDYKIMKSYGIKGVTVKLTEYTTYKNPYAKSQVENAQAAGLVVSAYHYSWFTDEKTAAAEAQYFAKYANELKLPKNTVMVNDLEEPQISSNKKHTENSQAFKNKLSELGFKNGQHYIGLSWLTSGKVNASQLGYKNIWVAAYPYTPKNQQYTEYGAWQWSSQLTFPNVSGRFDISSDYAKKYTGDFAGTDGGNTNGSKIVGYVTLKKNVTLFDIEGSAFVTNGTTAKYLNQTLAIKESIKDSSGETYYLLMNTTNQTIGYVRAKDVTNVENSRGSYYSYGKYVTITNSNGSLYRDKEMAKPQNLVPYDEMTYIAKGYYEHFNGTRYLSLYDSKNNWIGYVAEKQTSLTTNQGNDKGSQPFSYEKYVTIHSKNSAIYENLNGLKKGNSENLYQKTYYAKDYYTHVSGYTYASLYDNKNNWLGYINTNATRLSRDEGMSKGGTYVTYEKYVTITSKRHAIYSNLNGIRKGTSKDIEGHTVLAKGYYNHFNGYRYLSIYDKTGTWLGYINEDGTKLAEGKQGIYLSYEKPFQINVINSNFIWNSFDFVKKRDPDLYKQKTALVRGCYHHFNGNIYLSLRELDGSWIGYINEKSVIKIKE